MYAVLNYRTFYVGKTGGIHVRWLREIDYCSIALEALQGWNIPSWGPIIPEVLLAESGVQRSDYFSALRRLA